MSLDVYLSFPPCEHCGSKGSAAFAANITHNLNKMAEAAGIYKALWRPEELGIKTAGELIEPLREGLRILKADPEDFEQYNPANGWGSYRDFVPWVEKYLVACEENPKSEVRVWK